MKMIFPSSMPVWEQLLRSQERKRVGRKHNHKPGPGKQRKPPSRDTKRDAAWRAYRVQFGLYMSGHRDYPPTRPDES